MKNFNRFSSVSPLGNLVPSWMAWKICYRSEFGSGLIVDETRQRLAIEARKQVKIFYPAVRS